MSFAILARELAAYQLRALDEGPELRPRRLPGPRDHAAIGAGKEVPGIHVRQRLPDPCCDQRGRLDLLGADVDDPQEYVFPTRPLEDRHVHSRGRALHRDLHYSLHSFPTRRSSDLARGKLRALVEGAQLVRRELAG